MEITDFIQSVAALIFVLALIALVSFLLRKYGHGQMARPAVKDKRLALVDALVLDGRRKLVLVKRDETEHLLLIGAEREILIESDIQPSGHKAIQEKTWKVEE